MFVLQIQQTVIHAYIHLLNIFYLTIVYNKSLIIVMIIDGRNDMLIMTEVKKNVVTM